MLNINRSILLVLMFLSSFLITTSKTLAGSNPLTQYETVGGIGFFDLVVSLDWEPTQAEKAGLLKTAFEQFAKDAYKMTEGKHKLRKIYVYTENRQMNTADIQLLDQGGRANAHAGGIFLKGGRILAYTRFYDDDPRDASYIGHTIAHEFGHYAYSLYDEYRDNDPINNSASFPQPGDTPRESIMNHHWDYQWFTTATDYANPNNRKTAHWRVYHSSAWETLVGHPNNDKIQNKFVAERQLPRILYDEFKGMKAPTALTLNKPEAGWNSDFEIIYPTGTVAILVIDNSGSMAGLPISFARSAAKQFVDLMQFGEKVAVVSFNSTARTEIAVTELIDLASKDRVKVAIDKLDAEGGTDFNAALSQTQSVLEKGTLESNTRYVIMMSDGQASEPNMQYYQNNSIPIFTIGLGEQIDEVILRNIATKTQGSFTFSPTNELLASIYGQIKRERTGNEGLLAQNNAQFSSAGELKEWTSIIDDLSETTTFRLSWNRGDTVSFNVKKPDGSLITAENLFNGVTYTSGETYAIYVVKNPEKGTWTSVATAKTLTTDGKVTQEISSETNLGVDLVITGGQYPEPIGIIATVAGPEPVIGAEVVAQVTLPVSASVIDISLKDNGVSPDHVPNDGVYAAVFPSYSEEGNYQFRVIVSNPNGNAMLDTSGALEKGTDKPPVSLPAFQREVSSLKWASGVAELPKDPANAIQLPTDNTLVWGAIGNDEDVVWYKFDAVKETTYFIQTSNLVSYDQSTMATLMTLYDSDASTEIASNSHYSGTNVSYLEWIASDEGTYFVKVQHASPGTGAFGITVGTTNIFSTNTLESDEGETGSDDEGGGCTLKNRNAPFDPLFPLMIIVSLLYIYRRSISVCLRKEATSKRA